MIKEIRERPQILAFLCRDPFLHIYAIGDLDEFFWPFTRWFGWEVEGELQALFLLYTGDPSAPTLLALEERNPAAARSLLRQVTRVVQTPLQIHFSVHLQDLITSFLEITEPVPIVKMGAAAGDVKGGPTGLPSPVHLGPTDEPEILEFYEAAYPDNWFDPRMLATGYYLGVRVEGRLASVAGIHVYSPQYRVAALGNIATHPEYRGRGFAGHLTSQLSRRLSRTVDYIGLNVREDNPTARRCYQRLGFRDRARFAVVSARQTPASSPGQAIDGI
jgi:ribosomal protein S18 acetylase RimI-like enzyme